MSIDEATRYFASEVRSLLYSFYRNRIIRGELFLAVNDFNKRNKQLGNCLVGYFSQNIINRFFSGTSNQIRKTISEMHIKLNEITSLKIEYEETAKKLIKDLETNEVLNKLEDYFKSEINEQILDFDINSNINTMSFAASETSDLSMIKATVFASFFGAIIGGLLTILFTMFLG